MRTVECSISGDTYRRVYERDKGRCIFCGRSDGLQCAHFVARSQGGKGIEQNLAMLCLSHHIALDNGADTELRNLIKMRFEMYLKSKYEDWNKDKLIYKKG